MLQKKIMSCQIEQIADCGDISSIARSLFISDKEGKDGVVFSMRIIYCNLLHTRIA